MIATHAMPGATFADLAGVRAVGRIGAVDTPYGPTFVPPGPYHYVTLPHVFIGDGVVAAVCDRLYTTAGATVNAVMYGPPVTAVVFVSPPGTAGSRAATASIASTVSFLRHHDSDEDRHGVRAFTLGERAPEFAQGLGVTHAHWPCRLIPAVG